MEKQYSIVICTVTRSECKGINCSECEDVRRIRVTEFNSKEYISGIKIKTSFDNVVGKTDIDSYRKMISNPTPNNLSTSTETYKCPDKYPQYRYYEDIRRYNNLGEPDLILSDNNKIGVFIYGDVVYFIAPLIELEEEDSIEGE